MALIQVGRSEEVKCDGKLGGSYLWRGHDFILTLPPNCADGSVAITLKSYLPSSTQEHCFVSAVFDITSNIKNFKKPVTIRFPHCANIKSDKDKEKLCFLVLREKAYELKQGYFEAEKPFGSIEVTEFCRFSIICKYIVSPVSYCLRSIKQFISRSQNKIEIKSNLEEGHTSENISRKYLDVLILPEHHNEMKEWHGTYCIIQDNSTYWQVN